MLFFVMNRKTSLLFFFYLFSQMLLSQSLSQTVRGTVTDIVTKLPLPGANIIIQTTDPIMVKDAVLQGMGVGLLPEVYCRDALASGDLVEVFNAISLQEKARSSAVYTSKRMLNARTRAFIDFLKEICASKQ